MYLSAAAIGHPLSSPSRKYLSLLHVRCFHHESQMYTWLVINPVSIDLPLPPLHPLSPVDHARPLTISLLALSPAVLISSGLILLMPLLCIYEMDHAPICCATKSN